MNALRTVAGVRRIPVVAILIAGGALIVAACSSPDQATDPPNTTQVIDYASPERERAFLESSQRRYGDLAALGYTDQQWLSVSYSWCATLQAVGSKQAYQTLRLQVEQTWSSDQWDIRYAFAVEDKQAIEQFLC